MTVALPGLVPERGKKQRRDIRRIEIAQKISDLVSWEPSVKIANVLARLGPEYLAGFEEAPILLISRLTRNQFI